LTMLAPENTALLIIDIQGPLAQLMYEKEKLFDHCRQTILGAQALELPILWAEHVPEKMGPTVSEIAELLDGHSPLLKSSFSCCGEEKIKQALQSLGRSDILVIGIEAHVCVYQTVLDLIDLQYRPHLISDAMSARTPENKALALSRMQEAGASITGTEMVLFELMKVAQGEAFKKIIKIVK